MKFLRKVLAHSDVDNNSSARIVVRRRNDAGLSYLRGDFVKIPDLCFSLVDHCLRVRRVAPTEYLALMALMQED